MDTWFKAQKAGDGIGHIAIFSDIGMWGVTATDFKRELDALGNVGELRLAIGSNGGDVFTGFQIYNMLARHPAHKVVTVEGLAASMGSVIAMAGDEVVMPENSMLMIHNPFGGVAGEADEVVSFGEALGKMRANIIQAYRNRTGLSATEIGAMMDRTSWLDAKEAKAKGFADRIEKPMAITAKVDVSKFTNVPASFGRSTPEKTMTTQTEDTPKVKTAAEIRAEVVAQGNEVRSMCALAGFPEMADSFIAEDKNISDVVKALGAAKEKKAGDEAAARGKGRSARAADEVNARHSDGRDDDRAETPDLDPAKIYARWNSSGR
jgi:ATP-dependent Clp protease protease subunit